MEGSVDDVQVGHLLPFLFSPAGRFLLDDFPAILFIPLLGYLGMMNVHIASLLSTFIWHTPLLWKIRGDFAPPDYFLFTFSVGLVLSLFRLFRLREGCRRVILFHHPFGFLLGKLLQGPEVD